MMDERRAEGGRARPGIGADQVVPKRCVQRQGGWPETELPGFVAVRGCRGNSAPLIGTREGADQRAAGGFAPSLDRRGGPPVRAVQLMGARTT